MRRTWCSRPIIPFRATGATEGRVLDPLQEEALRVGASSGGNHFHSFSSFHLPRTFRSRGAIEYRRSLGDLRLFDVINPEVRYGALQDIDRELVSPCLEILSSISWDRLAIEYRRGQQTVASQSLSLTRVNNEVSEARRGLMTLEGQFAEQLAWCAEERARDASQ